ncbi:hypothetical protein HDV64DRAFT_246966 [Trichoderma sp. TUCIM 5745]
MAKGACLLPFDSIMVDMSHHFEDLAKTKELAAYSPAHGKTTAAEPGRIEGGEDGVLDTLDLAGLMTSADEAQQFVHARLPCPGVWERSRRVRSTRSLF